MGDMVYCGTSSEYPVSDFDQYREQQEPHGYHFSQPFKNFAVMAAIKQFFNLNEWNISDSGSAAKAPT